MICDLIWGYALDCILFGHSDLPTLKKTINMWQSTQENGYK